MKTCTLLLYAAAILLLFAFESTLKAQIWISSGFIPNPSTQQVTAYCSTSALDPLTGQASAASTDYGSFIADCSVTSSSGQNYTSSQCPTSASSADAADPTSTCTITFQPQQGLTYTLSSAHYLWFNLDGHVTNCPGASWNNALCYLDPEGYWKTPPAPPSFSTQLSSTTQQVTGPMDGTGVSQIIPESYALQGGGALWTAVYWPVGYTTTEYSPSFNLSKNIGDPCDIPGCDGLGDPINVSSGNVFEKVTDYETTGQNKLSYIRYYNSLPVASTLASELGSNWRSNYDRYLQLVSSTLITAERPDGQQINFYNNGGPWTCDGDVDYTLTQSGTTWTLTDHDGTTEVYSAISGTVGRIQSITLRNGYTQTMTYNPNSQLISVTDSYNRQLVLTYTNGGTVYSVTTPDGLVLTYEYNSVNYTDDQLASVSYSGSPTTSQQYLYQNAALPYALTSILDENGATYRSWTYDSMQRGLTSQGGGTANLTTVTYNDANSTRTVTNALGVTDTYTLGYLQNDLKIASISRTATGTTAAGTETFAYDTNGYVASKADWNGNQTTYVNDSHGDPTIINEAVGSSAARTTTIAYDATWVQLPDTITTPGLTTAFTYDGSGNVLTKTLTDSTTQSAPYSTSGASRVWQYTWQNSLLASVQSPRTDLVEKTTYAYDGTGALTGITNPLNQQTTISSHTGGGLPLTMVDPNGITTNLTYDSRQHLLTSTVVTAAGNRTTTYGYDAAENLTSVTQPDGSGLTYTYDAAHRLTAITDSLGQKISYTLDALGDRTATNILNASSAVTRTHSNAFDALGEMLQDIGASSQASSFTYDAVGNMVTAADQASKTTHRSFDALNRLYRIQDPASGITTTSYDAHDRLLAVTAPTGVATGYVYDGFGDVIQESNPNTGNTTYYYDGAGNMIERVAATGAVTLYTYDALDRVLTKTFPSDSAENVAYTYDEPGHGYGIGRLTSVSDAAGTLSRGYDELGNLLIDARTTSADTLITAYTYDAANRIASIAYPSGATVCYTRDAMGQISAVAAEPSGGASTPVVSNVSYEPFGPYATLANGNGVAEARSYDQDYRLTGITDTGTSTLQNLAYAYYPTNNVQTITDAVDSTNSQGFGYDSLQRLNQATSGYGSFGFTYDGDGNQLSQTLGAMSTTYGYSAGRDLLATISVGGVATEAIGYTADGRMASLNPGIQAPGGQLITSLSYNQDGRLASVNAAGGALASYTYDGFGQRLLKTISAGNGEIYQYGQDGMLLEETDSTGVAQADYIYLGSKPVAVLNGSALYYLHTDHLGTPQLATDSNQAVQWQASYEPFGQASVSGTVTQNLRFPGQYFDAESGWNHNGFRDYVPTLGRYAEPDPLGRLGSGNNLYAYTHNNPVNRSDPYGLWDTYTHHALIWNALRSCGVSSSDIWQLQQESDFIDLVDQLPDDAYKHAMKAPWQSPQSAIDETNKWIQNNLDSAAQMYQQYGDTSGMDNPTDTWTTPFGDAVHAMTDATSPMHRQNGIPLSWPEYPNAFHHGGSDNPFGSGETWTNMTPQLMQQNIRAIQQAFERVTGKKCRCQ